MVKISIIMPVYNKEKYLSNSLDSVLTQTFQDFELLCINDGSTDKSLQILNEYAVKDSRVKVFNKINTGVSDTRNYGLDRAQGEYIMFLDADDLLVSEAAQVAIDSITENDSDISIFMSNITKHLFPSAIGHEWKEGRTNPDCSEFQMLCWDKIYSREFLTRNTLRFKEGLVTAEDTVFCFLCMACNPRYSFINKELHQYVRSDNGASRDVYAIYSDLESFKYLFSCASIKNQTQDFKLKIINMKCRNLVYWYKSKFPKKRKLILKAILEFIDLFLNIAPLEELLTCNHFVSLWKIILKKKFSYFMYYSHNMKHKVIKFAFIKIKIPCGGN